VKREVQSPAAVLAAIVLTAALLRAQETQTVPSPVPSSPAQTSSSQQQPAPQPPAAPVQPGAQAPTAPVERREPHPHAATTEPVAGPLTKPSTAGPASQPADAGGAMTTIRVQTRLVNVALNVVDPHGVPVGGFEQKDFELFEDGKPRPIAVFEREATSPLSIVLAIDSSETVLTSDRLEHEAAKHFVRAILREQDELDLMDFADTVREIVPFTNQAKRVEQGLGQLQRGQETALYNAVYLASDRLASTSAAAGRRRVLVLISDGGNSLAAGGESYEQAVEEAERAGAIIYSVIIVPIAADAGRNTGGEHALIQMSNDTGGKYYYVEDPRDLEPAFQHVSDDLRTQYMLGYYAPLGGDTSFRRIKVKLTDPGAAESYSLRYRTGYFPEAR
jgi:Ca-activated chloride channel homolog